MAYDQIFPGVPLLPSQVSLLTLALTADTQLQWPLEANTGGNVVAGINEVTPAAPNLSVIMPDATQGSPGQTQLFYNAGATSYTVKSSTGTTLLVVSPGLTWSLYLRDNSTPTGLWRTTQYGASTAAAQASALAGLGIIAQGSLLSQSQPVVTFSATYTAGASDRASTYVWTGALGTLNLTAASVLGNNWFMSIRNGGSGNLTITPAGGDTINGASTLVLRPSDSATINCDGTHFYTTGLGQSPVFAFDYTSIDLTGLSGTYTLSGSELNRISYDFVGALAGNIEIVVPPTTQQYWVANDTTGGSFTLTLGTAGQVAPINVVRGGRGIFYCDGANVKNADTASIATPIGISDGGTGATTASAARINLGGTTVGIGVFTAASAAAGRSAIGGAASGANSDITSLTGLTTPLSVAQGGTGVATLTGIPKASGTSALVAATAGTDYAKPSVTSGWTVNQFFQGSTTSPAISLVNAIEGVNLTGAGASGAITIYPSTASIYYSNANATGNWTINITFSAGTTMDTVMSTGQGITVAHLASQGASPFFNTAVTIDGAPAAFIGWQGGAPVAGHAFAVDVYSYTVIKVGAATFVVLASQTPFT